MTIQKEWWRGGIIYQIYPRSFMDSNNDGVGDLNGITSKLDHVASLGVDGIWISPFFKSPMKDFGYDVADYCAIDPVFGTMDDFRAMLDRAHKLDLKVMIDQVWSHTSDQHDWFKTSRANKNNDKADWYIWANPKADGTAPNNWLSYFGGPAWTWDAQREQYYFHQFLKEQPTLNLWNPSVKNAIRDVARFWLDMGVDGFRLDAMQTYLSDPQLRDNPACTPGLAADLPKNNPMAYQLRKYTANLPECMNWIEEMRAFINQKWPDTCLLAEVGGDDPEKAGSSYVQTGKRCHLAYSFALTSSTMTFQEILRPAVRVEELIKDGWFCWATGNHDSKRVVSRIKGNSPDSDKALFATMVGLSLRGSYCFFEGEELGLPQTELTYEEIVDPYDKMLYPQHVGRDGGRTPIPWKHDAPNGGFSTAERTWLPVPQTHKDLAVDLQEKDPNSVLNRMRNFILWRKKKDVLRLGDIKIIEMAEPILAFRRSLNDEEIICIFNCGDAEKSISADIVGKASLLSEVSTGVEVKDGSIRLRGFGAAFFGSK